MSFVGVAGFDVAGFDVAFKTVVFGVAVEFFADFFFTVILQIYFLPATFAVIFAFPAFFAVTTPFLLTVYNGLIN